ncbi:MAG: hypothetical protein AVDCRST_MAG03-3862, partial [uncultured Rubrobacteraceae bacterium]
GLLRAVCPRAGGLLRHRRDCRAGRDTGPPRRGAGRGAREVAAGERGRQGGRLRRGASGDLGRPRDRASRAQGRPTARDRSAPNSGFSRHTWFRAPRLV